MIIPVSETINIPLNRRQRPDFDTISVTCDKNQLILEESDTMDYAPQIEAVITAKKEAVYLLKAYMKSVNGRQRVSKIIGAYKYKDGRLTDVSEEYPWPDLEYLGNHMEKVTDHTFLNKLKLPVKDHIINVDMTFIPVSVRCK